MCMHSILQYYKIYKQHADVIDAHMDYSFHMLLTHDVEIVLFYYEVGLHAAALQQNKMMYHWK